MRHIAPAWTAAFVTLLIPATAAGQWTPDGVVVCAAPRDQHMPVAVSDGAGGAIIAWEDARAGGSDIFAQRIDAAGFERWAPGGVAICAAPGDQFSLAIAADGAGGAIIAWEDLREGPAGSDVYVQRVDASGAPRWAANGVAACAATGPQHNPAIVADGAGGAILAWWDGRGPSADVYAQRVDAAGAPRWTADGIAVCAAAGSQMNPVLAPDGAGGAIVAWFDTRVFAQRLDASGAARWTAEGVAVCGAGGAQSHPAIAADGAGGAIVAWFDSRNGAGQDVYAQRVDAGGVPRWGGDGVALCTAAGDQFFPAVVGDGSGGAFAAWRDFRGGSSDVFAQHVDSMGVTRWADGTAVCVAPGEQFAPVIAAVGEGRAVVAWYDFRSGGSDVYARALSLSGAEAPADGAPVCSAPGDQLSPALAADGTGGAIIAWDDARGGADFDIRAALVGADAAVPVRPALVDATAGPGRARLRWYAPGRAGPVFGVERRTAADGWRAVAELAPDGAGFVHFEDSDVRAGVRYGYRLAYRDEGRDEVTAETWLEIPRVAAFAIEAVLPNPSRGDLGVSFTVPDGGPARLDVLDVAGRSVRSLVVDAPSPGAHVVTLGGGAPLEPGAYVVRLTHAGRSASAKAVVRR